MNLKNTKPLSVNEISSLQEHSLKWVEYFRENLTKQRVDWDLEAFLSPQADRKIIRSLQAWQKGETSDGSHLKRAAAKYAKDIDDENYLEAINLFIKEEQKHGENLGKYLDQIGSERLSFDLGDWLFRRVRYFNSSIELWTIAVIIVEMFAQFYYAAISKASDCPLLTSICKDILKDEVQHIHFQSERLQTILSKRSAFMRWVTFTFYKFLFCVITFAVWTGHNIVFKKAGMNFFSYWKKAYSRYAGIMQRVNSEGVFQ